MDYFSLRHLIREHGEDYGIFFDGTSGADSVSLNPELKRVTQVDVILNFLDESKTALTLQEIAVRLRSKSMNHAGFYINNLMEVGKVVRIDYMVYTTPKKAFDGVNTAAIISVVNSIMNITNIIVEADVFREYVNLELGLSYSKYFYMALVNFELDKLNWFRNNSLYSKQNIPYKNLMDMCKQLCDPDLSKNENIKILKESVWLTDGVISSAFRQWRRK